MQAAQSTEHAGYRVNELEDHCLQAVFDSFSHKNVLVNGRLEQGPVRLKDADLIEVKSTFRPACEMKQHASIKKLDDGTCMK